MNIMQCVAKKAAQNLHFLGGVWDFGSAAIIMYNQLVVFSLS